MIDDEKLIAAWFSYTSTDVLVTEFKLELKELYREWRRLKGEGRLPAVDRPRNPQKKRENELHTASDYDGRPSVGWHEDPLLERLKQVHKERRR